MARTSTRLSGVTTLLVLATAVVVLRAADYAPARRVSGDVPNPPVSAIGWVEAVIDLDVDAAGGIANAIGTRATPGGLNFILPSLKNWKFRPANDGDHAVASHVIVAAMMRPAQLFDPAGGSPAEDLKPAAKSAPYPLAFGRPVYPIKAVGNRSVLVEVLIRSDGQVDKATVIGTTSGFDGAALTAAQGWSFRPARHEDKAVAGVAYLIFGFRMPV